LEEDVETTSEDVNGRVDEVLETGIGEWDSFANASIRDGLTALNIHDYLFSL